MAPLPVIKLLAILFKEFSKPLAAAIRTHSQNHPRARRLATAMGRGWESASQRLVLAMEGNRLATAKPVTDSHAMSVGAELVAQGFLLASAMGLVMAEYVRGAWLKAAEDAERDRRLLEKEARAEARLRGIEHEVDLAHARCEQLEARLAAAGLGDGAGTGGGGDGGAGWSSALWGGGRGGSRSGDASNVVSSEGRRWGWPGFLR